MKDYDSIEMKKELEKSWKRLGYEQGVYDAIRTVSSLSIPRVQLGEKLCYVDHEDVVYMRAVKDALNKLGDLINK